MRAAPAKPDVRIATAEETVEPGRRGHGEGAAAARSDGDKARDRFRLELWQAAIGYNLSPCDETMKKMLVEALTKYIDAWAEVAGCRNGACSGAGRSVDAAAAFGTPADLRVRQTLREALGKGGIAREDFPRSIRHEVAAFAAMPSGEPAPACGGGRRAESSR
jgi:hypothetical protein